MFLLNIVVSSKDENTKDDKEIKKSAEIQKVGRNEKCPCGSGKKYKYCHGNT